VTPGNKGAGGEKQPGKQGIKERGRGGGGKKTAKHWKRVQQMKQRK